MKIATRSWSGVLPISVALEGQEFSCKFDCAFCPNESKENGAEKTIARSYLSTEGTFKRGEVSQFNATKQVIRRLAELETMGHFPDKLEIIVLGGTWDCYPLLYRESFLHQVFYGANLYVQLSPILGGVQQDVLKKWLDTDPFLNKTGLDFEPDEIRQIETLEEEKRRNQEATGCRIIGIVLETRPDTISTKSLSHMRKLGCTRIQLGIQHTSDMILDFNNRGHTNRASTIGIKKCRDNGFKVDVHIMPDLPYSYPSLDLDMFFKVFRTEDYQPDYVKVYPCLDLPFTQTRKWKEEGVWIPYAENDYPTFLQTMVYGLSLIPPWTRINRVHRDFPEATEKNLFLGYESETLKTNLHQLIKDEMKKKNLECLDIRSREIKRQQVDVSKAQFYLRSYWAGGGKEWFVSLEIPKSSKNVDDAWLLGFVRLRIPSPKNIYKSSLFPLFQKEKLGRIRELHVYGFIAGTKDKSSIQHQGIGKSLMKIAETIAWWEGCSGCAVISGVGVRSYYQKLGYHLHHGEGEFMVKRTLPLTDHFSIWVCIYLFLFEKEWYCTKQYDFTRGSLMILPTPTTVFSNLFFLCGWLFIVLYLIPQMI